ncbi:MAG: hypothetical protein ACRDJI_05090 [Actinomycetota bacterium]
MKQTRVQTTKRRRGQSVEHGGLVFGFARPARVVREAERVAGLIDRALQSSR